MNKMRVVMKQILCVMLIFSVMLFIFTGCGEQAGLQDGYYSSGFGVQSWLERIYYDYGQGRQHCFGGI